MSDQPQDDKKQPVYKASNFRFGHIDAEGRVVIHQQSPTEQIINFHPDQSLPEPIDFSKTVDAALKGFTASAPIIEGSSITKGSFKLVTFGGFTMTFTFRLSADDMMRLLALFGLKPIRITWIRPRHQIRRPKASIN